MATPVVCALADINNSGARFTPAHVRPIPAAAEAKHHLEHVNLVHKTINENILYRNNQSIINIRYFFLIVPLSLNLPFPAYKWNSFAALLALNFHITNCAVMKSQPMIYQYPKDINFYLHRPKPPKDMINQFLQ